MRNNVFSALALAAGVLPCLPAAALAQGLQLKPGWVYAIAFADNGNGANGNASGGNGQQGNAAPVSNAPMGKSVALYKVVGAADQSWYRVRPIARTPQGVLIPMPGTGEMWVNLNYAMWVQEVLR